MIDDNVKLRPCPFCGEKATMWKVATALYAVGCFGDVLCPCNITKVAPLYYDKELAIKRWNSRAGCNGEKGV